MKIGILGAGISGLSIAQLLKGHFDVEVLEKEQHCGGIARTQDINGIAYHTVGGHCFNSKYQDVLDFVFNQILPIENWNKIKRKSKIKFHGHEIDYPIEFSIKQIYKYAPKLAEQLTFDFIQAKDDGKYDNLEEWFQKKFGYSLAKEYFIPYNTKIWNNDPKQMSYLWVEDKLPIPNKELFFKGLIDNLNDNMAHFEFYYPKSNNQNTFIDALAKDLDISYNFEIKNIKKTIDNKWIINDIKEYDLIINTTPLNKLVNLIVDVPEKISDESNKLRANGISNVLWETEPTDKTWTYIPDKNYLFHRYIHIGSFFNPNLNYAISEVIGKHSFDEMSKEGTRDPFLLKPLSSNYSELAYVVFDDNYQNATKAIKTYLREQGIYTLGRFGEWQYYNMDVCIKKAIDLSSQIIGLKRN